jgi:type I restriction-modification system DNA methylase subunit
MSRISPTTNDLLALSDIARMADARPSAVSNWRRRYDDFPIEVRREGRQVLFDREEVLRWLEQHRPDLGVATTERLPKLDDIREISQYNDLSEVALALVCLTALAPDEVSTIAWNLPREARMERIANLSEKIELDLEMPDLFVALRDRPPDVDADAMAHRVTEAFHLIAGPDVGPPTRELAAEMFEYLLEQRTRARSRRFAETRSADWLAGLIVNLAEADRGLVLDPAAGEAGFLLAAGRAATERVELLGWELNAETTRLARQRMVIHRLPGKIEQVDSLGDSSLKSVGASAVISDPPLGVRERPDRWSAADPRWVYGLPAPHAELAWVQLALYHLRQGGRAAILTGHGALFRSGYEARIRAQLLQDGVVEGIIGLPPGSALYTNIPVALWLLRKPGVRNADDRVLFIDASSGANPDDGARGVNRPLDRRDSTRQIELVERIEQTVLAWRGDPGSADLPAGFAAEHPGGDLLAGDANLTPARLVHVPTSHFEIVEAAEASLVHHADVRSRLAALPVPELPDLPSPTERRSTKLGELFKTGRLELISGRRGESTTDPPGVAVIGPWSFRGEPLRYDDTGAHRPWLRPGDVVLRPDGGGFRAFVNELAEAALEAPLQAIRLNAPDATDAPYLDPALLAEMINIQKVAPAGTTGRYSVKNIEIPILDRASGEEIVRFLSELRREGELQDEASRIRTRLRELLVTALTG